VWRRGSTVAVELEDELLAVDLVPLDAGAAEAQLPHDGQGRVVGR
jgi:hypothetical protein